jgi:hypothetical protein
VIGTLAASRARSVRECGVSSRSTFSARRSSAAPSRGRQSGRGPKSSSTLGSRLSSAAPRKKPGSAAVAWLWNGSMDEQRLGLPARAIDQTAPFEAWIAEREHAQPRAPTSRHGSVRTRGARRTR